LFLGFAGSAGAQADPQMFPPSSAVTGSDGSARSSDYVRKPTDPPRFDPSSPAAARARDEAQRHPVAPPEPSRPVGLDSIPAGPRAQRPEQRPGLPEQHVGLPQQPVGLPQRPVGLPEQPVGVPEQRAGLPQQPVAVPEQSVGSPLQPPGLPEQQPGLPERQPQPIDGVRPG